jgi:hypothetical protein
MAMSEGGIDLADISASMGHSRVQTTRSHYVSVLGSRVQTAFESIDARIDWNKLAAESRTPAKP